LEPDQTRCEEARVKEEKYRDKYRPFLTTLCIFFNNFFGASGCAIGDSSSRGIENTSFFSFLDFLGD